MLSLKQICRFTVQGCFVLFILFHFSSFQSFFLAYFWLSLSSLKIFKADVLLILNQALGCLYPPVIPTLIILTIRVWVIVLIFLCRVFSYFIVPLFSANTSGALSYKVVRSCDITAANYQHPDPHKLIFSSLLMKMQLTGENISRKSLKYFCLFFISNSVYSFEMFTTPG